MNEIVIKIEGLAELTAAINKLAGQEQPEAAEPATQTVYVNPPLQNPVPGTTPTAQMPVSQPPVTQYSVPQPFQNPAPAIPAQTAPVMPPQGMVPTTVVAQEYTYDQLAVAAAGLVNQGKQSRLLEILNSFGVSAMTEIPKERYGEFATAIKAEGAVI